MKELTRSNKTNSAPPLPPYMEGSGGARFKREGKRVNAEGYIFIHDKYECLWVNNAPINRTSTCDHNFAITQQIVSKSNGS